jgi:hypothetical protein
MLLQLAFIIAPIATGSMIVARMRAEEAEVRVVFSEEALPRSRDSGEAAPEDCVNILGMIPRKSFVIEFLSSFHPEGLERLENDCIARIRDRHIIELTKLVAAHPVSVRGLSTRLNTLYHMKQAYPHANTIMRRPPRRGVFEGHKQTVLRYLIPLLCQESSRSDIDNSYQTLRGYVQKLHEDPSMHDRAIKGVLEQAYAEMFTLRNNLAEDFNRDVRQLQLYLNELMTPP